MSDESEEYNPEDVVRELLVNVTSTLEERAAEFREEAKRSMERAERLKLQALEQAERSRVYSRHADLLTGYKDAGGKFVAEKTRSVEVKEEESPGMRMARLAAEDRLTVRDEDRARDVRAMPNYGM